MLAHLTADYMTMSPSRKHLACVAYHMHRIAIVTTAKGRILMSISFLTVPTCVVYVSKRDGKRERIESQRI